jgi:hypothetical protein
MVSCGMLRRVALVRTDVWEERSASIRVTRISKLGTMLLVTLMKEDLSSSETSVRIRATRRNIPENTLLRTINHLRAYNWRHLGTLSSTNRGGVPQT